MNDILAQARKKLIIGNKYAHHFDYLIHFANIVDLCQSDGILSESDILILEHFVCTPHKQLTNTVYLDQRIYCPCTTDAEILNIKTGKTRKIKDLA